MKKALFFVVVLAVGVLTVRGQEVGSTIPIQEGATSSLTSGYIEPDNCVFSYMPVSSDNAYTSDFNTSWKCYQSFSGVTGAFNTVTVWVLHVDIPDDPREISVEIYEAGSTPSVLVSSTLVSANPVNSGNTVLGYDVYKYILTIPSISMSAGWVSVQATSGGYPTFYWLNTFDTPMYEACQTDGAGFSFLNTGPGCGLAMCLSASSSVPFPYWAIIAVFVVAAGFVVFRFRRKIA